MAERLMATLASWLDLAPEHQEEYVKKLIGFGCDTPEMLTDLTLADFAELGFRTLHARRIIKLAASTFSAEGSEGEGATRLIGIGKFTSSIATHPLIDDVQTNQRAPTAKMRCLSENEANRWVLLFAICSRILVMKRCEWRS